jgi:hypothetical protein
LLVHLGSPEEGDEFLTARWPEARAVSDPDEVLYEGFGLQRGSTGQLLGPRVLWAGLKSTLSGHGFALPAQNPVRMSGWFLVHGGRVMWSHLHEHSGAPRRFEELEATTAALHDAEGRSA